MNQNKENKTNLCDSLNELVASDRYPFHMPGHKRQSLKVVANSSMSHEADGQKDMSVENLLQSAARFDITEIEGFDDLHHPQGVIKEEQSMVAKFFGAKESYFLVNGSTAGILAAICSQTKQQDGIILARNSHRSAYHAVYLNGLKVRYIYPQQINLQDLFHYHRSNDDKNVRAMIDMIPGPIAPQDVAKAMDESGYKIVCLTSPTYEGIVSDIRAIADEVHSRGGILIVDEAHGAHLAAFQTICDQFIEDRNVEENDRKKKNIAEIRDSYPVSAVHSGADIVIESLHKTLPVLTQTAILHVCSDRINLQSLKYHLDIFQTSSPSYLLMASISECRKVMEEKGTELLTRYDKMLSEFYRASAELMYLHVVTPHQIARMIAKQKGENGKDLTMQYMDPSKLVIYVSPGCVKYGNPYRGPQLAKELLETYHLDMEMTAPGYVLAMTSVMDRPEGFQRLLRALSEIDGKLHKADAAVAEDENNELNDAKDSDQNAKKNNHTNSGYLENVTKVCVTEKEIKRVIENQMTIRKAMDSESEILSLQDSVGRIAAEFVYRYPPGIPIVAPGEVITAEAVEEIISDENSGFTLHREGDGILVVR